MHVSENSLPRVIDRPDQGFARSDSEGFERLLNAITQSELEKLAQYARFRLNRAGLPPGLAEDVRQSALLAVLVGGQSEFRGRHPRFEDLGDQRSFFEYLKGVIRSLVEARWRSRENQVAFVSLDPEMIGAGGRTTQELASVEDLAQQLFSRLRKKVPKRLLPTLGHWAEHWRESEVIPLAGKHRRHRQELRAMAAKVLEDISGGGLPTPV